MQTIEHELAQVEALMQQFIVTHTNDEKLQESMRYSVQAGGKRIRPQIVLMVTEALGGKIDWNTYRASAAIEMIHTYSLIHDDLPAMDDDDLRRGKPTNHKVFGEAMAILAGDALLTMAFELLSHLTLSSKQSLRLIRLLAESAGASGMVAGQAADILAEEKQLALNDLMFIHRRKTGKLIECAFLFGAILAEASHEQQILCQQLGQEVGVAFQIRDDLLDVLSTTEELGKVVHRDEALQKSTYPQLLGIDRAKEAFAQRLAQADELLAKLAASGAETYLLQSLIHRLKID
ncbi:polyprenyl synthetase family protein [Enterococcus columbae]|uniref:Farnesyl diphosphate synthase n=1 Tax=Enterococcus columbae DSM 7374 = ATCC 51263 TaxID=1121865 RepID=S0KB07_9ENTE|nr:farnesyl diphosphate synthase [Enterococcus columbae]EOT42049.1 hypothetical protein OMW_01163 [Enterococcus columbae DSM 7374 = ATCC 51263]EOW80606.1 hypothetical protein I568_01783 [Enterococcus columbae DSM 7374 = ATCC 51263]